MKHLWLGGGNFEIFPYIYGSMWKRHFSLQSIRIVPFMTIRSYELLLIGYFIAIKESEVKHKLVCNDYEATFLINLWQNIGRKKVSNSIHSYI